MASARRSGSPRAPAHFPLARLAMAMVAAANLASLRPPAAAVAAIVPRDLAAFEQVVPARPSYVQVDGVSQKYPATLMDKLFSSVPRREYALRNITLSFGRTATSPARLDAAGDDGVTLLVGRSGSGKSALFRLLAGTEPPAGGRVRVNGLGPFGGARGGGMPGLPPWAGMGPPPRRRAVRPVILRGKPEFDDRLSVIDRIVGTGLDVVRRCDDERRSAGEGPTVEDAGAQLRALARDFTSLLTLSDEQCRLPPSALSPSGEYLFGIACGCAMSVAPSIAALDRTAGRNEDISQDDVHCPVLLLDELFDAEHPSTVRKCAVGMSNLVHAGAVVISATHRPRFFEGAASRIVTLSGGRVLTDEASAFAR